MLINSGGQSDDSTPEDPENSNTDAGTVNKPTVYAVTAGSDRTACTCAE